MSDANIKYVGSAGVQVFPAGFRSGTYTTSKMVTEENLTGLSLLSSDNSIGNRWFTLGSNDVIIIEGYKFVIKTAEIPVGCTYAAIKLREVSGTYVLAPYPYGEETGGDTATTLDSGDSFKGLAFLTSKPTEQTGIYWVEKDTKLALNTLEIKNGSSAEAAKAISEQFNSTNIIADVVTATNINDLTLMRKLDKTIYINNGFTGSPESTIVGEDGASLQIMKGSSLCVNSNSITLRRHDTTNNILMAEEDNSLKFKIDADGTTADYGLGIAKPASLYVSHDGAIQTKITNDNNNTISIGATTLIKHSELGGALDHKNIQLGCTYVENGVAHEKCITLPLLDKFDGKKRLWVDNTPKNNASEGIRTAEWLETISDASKVSGGNANKILMTDSTGSVTATKAAYINTPEGIGSNVEPVYVADDGSIKKSTYRIGSVTKSGNGKFVTDIAWAADGGPMNVTWGNPKANEAVVSEQVKLVRRQQEDGSAYRAVGVLPGDGAEVDEVVLLELPLKTSMRSSDDTRIVELCDTWSNTTTYYDLYCRQIYLSSDQRLKENIEKYEPKKSILDIPVYKYDFIDGPKNQIGCLAQDLEKICPELVSSNEQGYLQIAESKLVYLLLDEVKKLNAKVSILEEEVTKLKVKA